MRWLALLFFVVPFLELWLLLQVGEAIGFWPTIGIVLTTAMLGAYLAKREGLRVIHDWQASVSQGRMPEGGILSGILVLIGAVLLVTPGVLTDIVGLTLLFPLTRGVLVKAVEKQVEAQIKNGNVVYGGGPMGGFGGPMGGVGPMRGGPMGGVGPMRGGPMGGVGPMGDSAQADSADGFGDDSPSTAPRGGRVPVGFGGFPAGVVRGGSPRGFAGAVFDVRVVTPQGVYARRVVRNGNEAPREVDVEDLGWSQRHPSQRNPKVIEAEVVESETHRVEDKP